MDCTLSAFGHSASAREPVKSEEKLGALAARLGMASCCRFQTRRISNIPHIHRDWADLYNNQVSSCRQLNCTVLCSMQKCTARPRGAGRGRRRRWKKTARRRDLDANDSAGRSL